MIKKLISIVFGVLLSCGVALSMVGCHFHADPPKSIVIDGEKYVTGFYNEDHFRADNSNYGHFDDFDDPLFTKGDYNWYKILDTKYDIYGCNMICYQGWRPHLYCKESEFEEVKAYYADINNYTYSFRCNFKDWVSLSDDIDKEKMEVAIQEFFAVEDARDYNPHQGKNYPTLSAAWTEFDIIISVYIRRMSKDGALYTSNMHGYSYYYLNGQLCYRYSELDPSKEYILQGFKQGKDYNAIVEEYDKLPENFYILNDEAHTYMLGLFEEYALNLILAEPQDNVVKTSLKKNILSMK